MMIHDETTEMRRSRRGKRLDAIGWALFFIWIGITLLVKSLPAGAGALGLGAIVLFGTIARLVLGVSVSFFWIIIGVLFLLAGIGEVKAIDLPLLPIALIVCGVLLLFHRRSGRRGGDE